MSLQKTEAVVLKSIKQGETSKILTLYTRKFGKIKVIAKGARGLRSRYGGTLEPANYIAIVFYEKETRDLQFLSQADIIETYAKQKYTLEKSTLAMAACELVDRLEIGMTPNPHLFKIFLEALRGIHREPTQPMNVLRAFQIRIFDALGVKPNFHTCLQCKHARSGDVLFDIPRGGFLCQQCARLRPAGAPLSQSQLADFRDLQTAPIASLNGVLASATAQQQADHFLLSYFKFHVEGFRELNALKFLRKISHFPSAELGKKSEK
jgi:DNA repair protein RecO (recombination protein O)